MAQETSITRKVVIGGAIGSLVVVGVEHALRLNDFEKRPSYFLSMLANFAKDRFTNIGELLAWMSGFIRNLRLSELIKSFGDVLYPIWELITSWTYVGVGWVGKVKEYLDGHMGGYWEYVLGLMVIIGLGLYLAHKLGNNSDWCPFVRAKKALTNTKN